MKVEERKLEEFEASLTLGGAGEGRVILGWCPFLKSFSTRELASERVLR